MFRLLLSISILTILISGCSVFGIQTYETPKYEVMVDEQPYELRKYEPYTVAEVTVFENDIDEAQKRGFRILADYIFGNNIARDSLHRQVRMKEGETYKSNESISMTGPVLLDLNDQIVIRSPAGVVNMLSPEEPVELELELEQKWTMTFSLPSKYTLNTAPIPKNGSVRLREVPKELIITRRFTNFVTKSKVETLSNDLLKWANKKGLVIEGSIRIARFDPMWTVPFLRRNEIHISVKI
jgi:hypothetical protein